MSIITTLQALLFLAATPVAVLAQAGPVDPGTTGPAWSPYLVGALIGVLSMFTFYFSNKPLGGVIFGVGFALAAYCPGTSAVAFGHYFEVDLRTPAFFFSLANRRFSSTKRFLRGASA